MAFGKNETYERWIPAHQISNDYPDKFNFHLVTSLDELKDVLSKVGKDIALDTETTGLDLDVSFLVGYSFCFDGLNAYYVPVNHAPCFRDIKKEITKEEYDLKTSELSKKMDESDINAGIELNNYSYDNTEDKYYYTEQEEYSLNLGSDSVELLYNTLKDKIVYMFNARYDIRVIEKYGFIENNIPIEERDKLHIYKYDLSPSHCTIVDLQALIFDTDTNVPYPALKKCEEYFLGWRGASFADTVDLDDGKTFYNLKPEDGYQYACTDALGTYLLVFNPYVMSLMQESRTANKYRGIKKCSVELDTAFLYPLKIMEDEYTIIDTERLKSYSQHYSREIEKVETKLYSIVGDEFRPDPNDKKQVVPFASPKKKSEMLKKLGITTYEYDGSPAYNVRGELKADKEHIKITIDKLGLEPGNPKREFMEGLLLYATLTKQKGTYVDAFIKMANESNYPGRLRFGYKTMVVPSGRLAAGGDKKNHYTSETNIQNVPKPHTTTVYYVLYEDLIKVKPDLAGVYDNNYEEFTYNGEYTYRILKWVFKESVWNLGIPEKKIEGFQQDLNMRSTFCADPDKLWVSCDFSAQELRLAALLSGEPGWTKTFANNGDLHEYMAKQIWDPAEYDKSKRKKAKTVNFGILYGMTAKNFSNDFSISMEEAQEIVDKYKEGAKKLFDWVEREEKLAETTGSVYTMFGRPRRLGWYFSPERSYSMRQFGIRSTANTIIQGSGGDILKMSFLNIYDLFYSNPETRNKNREYVKFINTVHDEINYNVSKKYVYQLVPKILSCMRMWFPDWQFPMKVGLAISSRWGTNIDFEYDDRAFIPIEGAVSPEEKRYKQMDYEWQVANKTFGPFSFVEDPDGNFIKNPNFLGILEPSGEDLSEKDYIVKEKTEKKEIIIEDVPQFDPNEPKLFDNLV
ncbi:MAG: hypothetical protein J6T15_05290 [Bacilli bacterium]|nr:hypothetical protein [Bacilli bacterium]